MDPTLLEDWLKGREIIYRLLASLYREGPVLEMLQVLGQEGTLAKLAAEEAQEEVRIGCRLMHQELVAHMADLEGYRQKLEEDYYRLFVGPGHLEAPPWESVYRSPDRLLFGEETLAVREFYRSFGLVTKNLYREPDDHLGLELEFMAWLCAETIKNLAEGGEGTRYLQGQRRFLQEHLLQWVPDFCRDVTGHAKTDFFRGLGQFTRGFIQQDAEELERVLGGS